MLHYDTGENLCRSTGGDRPCSASSQRFLSHHMLNCSKETMKVKRPGLCERLSCICSPTFAKYSFVLLFGNLHVAQTNVHHPLQILQFLLPELCQTSHLSPCSVLMSFPLLILRTSGRSGAHRGPVSPGSPPKHKGFEAKSR